MERHSCIPSCSEADTNHHLSHKRKWWKCARNGARGAGSSIGRPPGRGHTVDQAQRPEEEEGSNEEGEERYRGERQPNEKRCGNPRTAWNPEDQQEGGLTDSFLRQRWAAVQEHHPLARKDPSDQTPSCPCLSPPPTPRVPSPAFQSPILTDEGADPGLSSRAPWTHLARI